MTERSDLRRGDGESGRDARGRAARPARLRLAVGVAACLLGIVACPAPPSARVARLHVVEEGPRSSHFGFNDVEMTTNGEALVARTVIDPHDVVFDVGAYVGNWSLYVLQQHPDVTLHAFEPTPESYAQLEKRLGAQGGAPVKMALSDSEGVMEFHVYPDSGLLNSFYQRSPGRKSVVIQVPTERLDTYCQKRGVERIDYLKIDTEGAELLVLRGAAGMLERHAIGLVQFEYGGTYADAGITLEEVFGLLGSSGYQLYRIHPRGLVRIAAWHDDLENGQYANYLAAAP